MNACFLRIISYETNCFLGIKTCIYEYCPLTYRAKEPPGDNRNLTVIEVDCLIVEVKKEKIGSLTENV